MTREVPRLATLAAGLLTGLCVVVGACASPAVALAVEDGTVWQSELFGIQLELPEGWTVEEREYGGGSLHVVFTPPDGSPARLSLLVNPSSPPDPSEMQDAGVMAVEGTPGYDNARRVTRQIGEREAPGLEIDADQGEARYLLRQAYVVEHGTPFILQDFADVSVAERMRPVFDEAWDGIRFPPRSPEVEARAALEALAARCGSEVEFAATWEEAALRARKERKPVLVAARIYPGYSISDSRMSGPFMDRDVVALVNARTVPLLMDKGDPVPFADHDVYGLGPSTFGEAALLVSPEGEVLGESRVLGEDWLREALVLAPKLPGTPVPSDATGLDLAEAHYARGELDRAAALLADDESLDALLQRVRLHRRLERGAEALAELDRALQLPEAAAHEAELSLERGLVLAGLGRRDEALTQLDAAIEGLTPDAGPAHERAGEALLYRGLMAQSVRRHDEAEPCYRRVLDEHGETRWAWLAAAMLTSTAWELGIGFDTAWLAPEDAREFDPVEHDPLSIAKTSRAREDALAFLLAEQQPDGSWRAPAELGRDPDSPPHDFELAVTAIAIQALLPHREQPEVAAALARAEDWLRTAIDAAEDEVSFMDYAVWSRAYLLWCVADLVRSDPERESERFADYEARAQRLVDDLTSREKPGGGWSYYVTRDVRAAGNATVQAMSFTTSAVVLALLAAEQAGFDVPRAALERGLDTIERAGKGRQTYEYMVFPSGPGKEDPEAIAGDTGRGPVCALALHRGGRASLDAIEDALELFDDTRDTYAKELGKTLMHTGPYGQGSHYLMFDYANAAFAVAALPSGKRTRYRKAVLTEVLRAHTSEGAFLDTVLNGRAYGSAMALLALDALR